MLCKPSHENKALKVVESADSASKDMSKTTNTTLNEDQGTLSSPEPILPQDCLTKGKSVLEQAIPLQNRTKPDDANGGHPLSEKRQKALEERMTLKQLRMLKAIAKTPGIK